MPTALSCGHYNSSQPTRRGCRGYKKKHQIDVGRKCPSLAKRCIFRCKDTNFSEYRLIKNKFFLLCILFCNNSAIPIVMFSVATMFEDMLPKSSYKPDNAQEKQNNKNANMTLTSITFDIPVKARVYVPKVAKIFSSGKINFLWKMKLFP